MDQTLLVRMLRLRTLAARKGLPFDVERFAADRTYAKTTLKSLLQTDDDELQAACLQTMDALRLTRPPRSGGTPQTDTGVLDTRPAQTAATDETEPAREPGELVDSEWP